MFLARLIAALIALGIGGVLAAIAFRGLSTGAIKPFRMQRWSEPDDVYQADSPAEFWSWVIAHFAFSAGAVILAILTLLGKLKLR